MLDRTEGLIHPLFTKNTNDTSCLPKGDRISHKLWKHPNTPTHPVRDGVLDLVSE